jgi:hypothetical protein
LGFKIYRKKEENGIMTMEWLQKDWYTPNLENARVFYHINDAMSALVLAKIQWAKETPTTSTRKSESEGIKEKKLWYEL